MGSHTPSSTLHLAGVYRRDVAAGLGRVWENVFDWEHLPALHSDDFHAVTLLDQGRWGWRVRLVNQPGDADRAQILEMRADKTTGAYRATTLDGPGAGTEIHTRLTLLERFRTGVEVRFYVPEGRPERLTRIGARYAEIYARLWDQDEAMMIERERAARLRRRGRRIAAPRPKSLGAVDSVRARLPLAITFGGERFRIVEIEGELLAHAATCPHWLGPLACVPVVDGRVRCPWHGYAFDIRTGVSSDGRGLALAPPPRVTISGGEVLLVR